MGKMRLRKVKALAQVLAHILVVKLRFRFRSGGWDLQLEPTAIANAP